MFSNLRGAPMRTWIVALLMLVGCVLFLRHALLPALRGMTFGFPVYYVPARLVVEGRCCARLYDDAWFSAQVLAMTQGQISDRFSPHPPSAALLALPLAWFDLMSARAIWFVMNGLLLGAGILFLNSALKRVPGISVGIEILALALLLAPVAETFRLGQVYILLFCFFSAAFWGLGRERPLTVGFALGIAAIFKLSGGPLWFVLAARGRWRELGASFAVALLFAALTVALLGWQSWFSFFSILPAYLSGHPQASHLAFQTTPSFFQHLFVADAEWNPVPLAHLPWLARGLTWGVTLTALGVTVWASRRAPLDLAFAAAMVLGVVLLPIAEEYHYTLLLIPFGVAMARLRLGPRQWYETALLALAFGLVALPLAYKDESLSNGWWAWFAYPRLYGGWLLWAWLLKRILPQPNAARVSSPSNAIR